MSNDRTLDPVTEDFIDADAGAFDESDGTQNQIAFSYLVEYGSWEGDPTLGHRFKELARARNTIEDRNRLRDLAKKAVQWLIDLEILESVEVTVESISAAGVAFEVDYYVPNSNISRKAGPFLIPVGGG
jgi:phage gp46-like protein